MILPGTSHWFHLLFVLKFLSNRSPGFPPTADPLTPRQLSSCSQPTKSTRMPERYKIMRQCQPKKEWQYSPVSHSKRSLLYCTVCAVELHCLQSPHIKWPNMAATSWQEKYVLTPYPIIWIKYPDPWDVLPRKGCFLPLQVWNRVYTNQRFCLEGYSATQTVGIMLQMNTAPPGSPYTFTQARHFQFLLVWNAVSIYVGHSFLSGTARSKLSVSLGWNWVRLPELSGISPSW